MSWEAIAEKAPEQKRLRHFSQECRTRKTAREPLTTQVSPRKHSPMSDWNGNSQTLAFIAGHVANHLPHWESITQDPVILSAILHYNIEFEEKPPYKLCSLRI